MEEINLKEIEDLQEAINTSLSHITLYYIEGDGWTDIMTEARVIEYGQDIYESNILEDGGFPAEGISNPPQKLEEAVRLIKWARDEIYIITQLK